MADRQVTGTGKDGDGDITGLCGAWGTVSADVAVDQIQRDAHRYYVQSAGSTEVDIHVVETDTGTYLRTDPDGVASDNLDALPDC